MNRLKKWIYSHSQKPSHYKEVKKPCRGILAKITHPQTARQQLYNKWCKEHQYYSGSYLPKKHKKLLVQGWTDETKNESSKIKGRLFFRKNSTNQWIRKDIKDSGRKPHYHWYAFWGKKFNKKQANPKNGKNMYYDKYGNKCDRNSDESHINGARK
jgi:hypothetical protein